MSGRFCKTCRHLATRGGEKPYKVCAFFETFAMPWASYRMNSPIIGERHWNPDIAHDDSIPDSVGQDWTGVMDCPQHSPEVGL